MQKEVKARAMQRDTQDWSASWTRMGSWEWSLLVRIRVRFVPMRAEVSCIEREEAVEEGEGEGEGEKEKISVADAANWRISLLMSCTAWRTCAPDQESTRVM